MKTKCFKATPAECLVLLLLCENSGQTKFVLLCCCFCDVQRCNINRNFSRKMFDKPNKTLIIIKSKSSFQRRIFHLDFFFSLIFRLCYMETGDSTYIYMYVGNHIFWKMSTTNSSPIFLVRCIMCAIVTVPQWFEVIDAVKNPTSPTSTRKKKVLQLPHNYHVSVVMLLHQWIEMQTWKMS